MVNGTGGRWLVAALAASAVLTSGGTDSVVDTEELPGVYRNNATGNEIVLESDGTFSATDVSTDSLSDPTDFSGRWKFVDSSSSSDFIYLTVDDGGLGRTDGIQLCTSGRGTVEFRTPDKPPSLVLTRVAAP